MAQFINIKDTDNTNYINNHRIVKYFNIEILDRQINDYVDFKKGTSRKIFKLNFGDLLIYSSEYINRKNIKNFNNSYILFKNKNYDTIYATVIEIFEINYESNINNSKKRKRIQNVNQSQIKMKVQIFQILSIVDKFTTECQILEEFIIINYEKIIRVVNHIFDKRIKKHYFF